MASRDDAHCCVLDALQALDVGGGGVGKPNRTGVGEEGLKNGFVSCEQGLLIVSPSGACQGLEHLESLLCLGFYGIHVLAEGEGGVEGDPKDFGGTIDGEEGLAEVDDGVVGVDLVRVAGEEGDGGCGGRAGLQKVSRLATTFSFTYAGRA